jgi:hypothetical protein
LGIRERKRALALAIALAVSTTSMASVETSLAQQLPALAPRAIEWAERVASGAALSGKPLSMALQKIAVGSGVRKPGSIRILVVDEIPLPDEPVLHAAALKVGLSQSSAAGLTLGYAVVVRRGYEDDVRLLSHEFRHVAQYEACGGIRAFLSMHLAHLVEFGYEDSPFEVDARAHEVGKL